MEKIDKPSPFSCILHTVSMGVTFFNSWRMATIGSTFLSQGSQSPETQTARKRCANVDQWTAINVHRITQKPKTPQGKTSTEKRTEARGEFNDHLISICKILTSPLRAWWGRTVCQSWRWCLPQATQLFDSGVRSPRTSLHWAGGGSPRVMEEPDSKPELSVLCWADDS